MDKKRSFLDVLVQAVYEKFPHLLNTSDELGSIPGAEKGKCFRFSTLLSIVLKPDVHTLQTLW